MTLSSVYVGFCLAAIVGQQPTGVTAVIHTARSALEAVITDWFPKHIEFNESCVAEGCPKLKNISLCPSDLDINALRSITKILSSCMQGPICGIIFDPRPFKDLIVSMEEFLPKCEIEGLLKLLPNSGHLSNISNIQLEMLPTENKHSPLQVTMLIPNLLFNGVTQIDLRLETGSGPTLTTKIERSTFDVEMQFIATFAINQTVNGAKIDIRVVNPVVTARPLLCGLDIMPSGFPDIHSMVTSTTQTVVEKSTMAKQIGNFIGRLYQNAIKVASNNCKKSN